VTEATKTFLASGLVDPNRVAIMGTDFGGFLALSGAAYEPSLYRCAISVSGVPDWGKLIADYKYNKYNNSYYSRMVLKLGDPTQNPEKWDAIAPLRHAGQIRASLFLATGEYDAPVDVSGAKELASAAERNHAMVETETYLNEANGVRHIRNKVDLFSRIEAFLAKNLGPVKTVAAAGSP
jgi:dipeptidyl aminopeptidase/acylaminoacyl peptidase